MGDSHSSTCFNTLLSPANICINKHLTDGGNNTHSVTLSRQMVWVRSRPFKSHSAHCNVVKCQHCILHTWLTGVADVSRQANDHWWAAQHQHRLSGGNLHSWELASTWDTRRIYTPAQCTKNSVGCKLKTTSNVRKQDFTTEGQEQQQTEEVKVETSYEVHMPHSVVCFSGAPSCKSQLQLWPTTAIHSGNSCVPLWSLLPLLDRSN